MKRKTSALLASLPAAVALLCSVPAAADESNPTKEELTTPQSSVELGAGGVSNGSFKFGEYNGLEDKGAFGIASFHLSGGGAYDSNDATRWHVNATDLGTTARSADADYGVQGRFRLSFQYDEIQHNVWDSYNTPYLGAGGNVLTLPATWQVPIVPANNAAAANARGLSGQVTSANVLVGGTLRAPNAAQLAQAAAIQAADLPSFSAYDLFTTRNRYQAGASFLLSPKWELSATAQHETKTGAQAQSTVTQATGEVAATLPNPINYRTDQFNVSFGRRSSKDFVQLDYNASFFHDDVRFLRWTEWADLTKTMTMSEAPGNQMQQLSATAGRTFGETTRVVAYGSYSRMTQDQAYQYDAAQVPLLPLTSPQALVIDEAANLKISSRPLKSLSLDLAYKYDERRNETPVNIYGFYDNNSAPAGTIMAPFAAALGVPAAQLGSNVNINENLPFSRKVNQIETDGQWHFVANQSLKLGYEYQQLNRWCEGTWYSCEDVYATKENIGRIEWRGDFSRVNGRLSYSFGDRTADGYTEQAFLAYVPMANVVPTGATLSAYQYMLLTGLTGYGPVAGLPAAPLTGNAAVFFPNNNALANAEYQNENRISELLGMLRYYEAPRRRNQAKGDVDFEVTEQVNLQGLVEYRDDNYYDTTYGLYRSKDLSATLDANYSPTRTLAFSAFYSYEMNRSRSAGDSYTANSTATSVAGFTAISGGCYPTIALRNASNKLDPCQNWSTDMRAHTNVAGLTAVWKNLMHERVDLKAQVVVTRASTDINVLGGSYANNPYAVAGAPAGTVAAYYIPAQALPTIIANSVDARLSVMYRLTGNQALHLSYEYAQLTDADFGYQGYQFGGATSILPTGQFAPYYHVQVFGLSYVATF